MLEKLTGSEIADFTVQVLKAHHIREAERQEKMGSSLCTPNKWGNLWDKFYKQYENEGDALETLTHFIQAQLDGDECMAPFDT